MMTTGNALTRALDGRLDAHSIAKGEERVERHTHNPVPTDASLKGKFHAKPKLMRNIGSVFLSGHHVKRVCIST